MGMQNRVFFLKYLDSKLKLTLGNFSSGFYPKPFLVHVINGQVGAMLLAQGRLQLDCRYRGLKPEPFGQV